MLRFLIIALLLVCVMALAAFVSDLVATFGKDTVAPLIAAIGVAAAAFLSVWSQHKTDGREIEARSRRARAARAILPGALAELQTYLRAVVDLLIATYPPVEGREVPRDKFVLPKIPENALKALGSVIEHSDIALGDYLARTIRMLQVQNSRMNRERSELFNPSVILLYQHDSDSMLIDAVVLYAFFEATYDYARSRSHEPPKAPSSDDFRRAARLIGVLDECYEFVHKKLQGNPSILNL